MSKSKFIILNGFAGSGKSTIGRRYIKNHPLALMIEGDELIVNLGHWLERENEARTMVYEMTKALTTVHLSSGYDVVLPYLVTDASHISAFENIASKNNAQLFNIFLFNEKDLAIEHLLKRGTWGEAGTDPLSVKDIPDIERLYDRMEAQIEHQKDVILIKQNGLQENDTYAQLIDVVTRLSSNV